MHIIILTPAVPRPNLHTKAMSSFYKNLALSDMSKHYFTHIINIDSPTKLIEQGFSVKDTIENYKSIIPSIVEQHYIDSQRACFSDTYKRLFIEGEKYIKNEDTVVIWLEDDWYITDKKKMLDTIETVSSKFDGVSPAYFTIAFKPHITNNNPTVYSSSLFLYFSNYYKQVTEKLDPDYLQHNCYKYKFSRKIKDAILTFINEHEYDNEKAKALLPKGLVNYFPNRTITVSKESDLEKGASNVFYFYSFHEKTRWTHDIGRAWLKSKNIKKWNKNAKNIARTYV